jgi:small acid-soluble spore protein F (minor alpha/beta-type SASP)
MRWDRMDKKDNSIKIEVINELGLLEKVSKYGWKSLTAKETGRIGGLVTRKKRLMEGSTSAQGR